MVKKASVPFYKELSMAKVWNQIKNIEDLKIYFTDLKVNELPEREFMWTVVSSIMPIALRNLVREAQKSLEKDYEEKDSDLVEIDPIIFEKIKETVCLKSKCLLRTFMYYLLENYSSQRQSRIFIEKVSEFIKRMS